MVNDFSHRPKKRFGQHFLHDQSVIAAILHAARITPDDRVIEIGPGEGVLTNQLLERAADVHIVEVDQDLIDYWSTRRDPNLTLHASDVLKLDWSTAFPAPPYAMVANLPYNISSPIVFEILEHRHLFDRLILMFQREVGERILAPPGGKDYGILSVLCQLWFDIVKVMIVKPGAFNPPPKVDSIVIGMTPLQSPRHAICDWNQFVRVVKGLFAQRRKTLRNNLKGMGIPADMIDRLLAAVELQGSERSETLSVGQFAQIANTFFSLSRQNEKE